MTSMGSITAVFGLGRAGRAACRRLAKKQQPFIAWDDSKASRELLVQDGFAERLVPSNEWSWAEVSRLVLSPGIPLDFPAPHDVVMQSQAHRVPIICEVDLLVEDVPGAYYLAVTGTNGKSTTTALLGHCLKKLGADVAVGGNIGQAASSLPNLKGQGYYVLELSSYQLALVQALHCRVAILLNITPDHLDRHGGMAGYIAAKKHIFDRQGKGDVAVVSLDTKPCLEVAEELKTREGEGGARCITLATLENVEADIVLRDGGVVDRLGRHEKRYPLPETQHLAGRHNAQNMLAVYAALRHEGYDGEAILNVMCQYTALPHRMQPVGEWGKVRFINDSKATNAEAAAQALRTYDHIYWLAGGVPKAEGVLPLSPLFSRVRAAYLYGEAAEVFAATLAKENVRYLCVPSLDVALRNAAQEAISSGEDAVVLLSPACASFDQFSDYEARGQAFAEGVERWIAAQENLA